MQNTDRFDAASLQQLRHAFVKLKTEQKLRNREAAIALGISEGPAQCHAHTAFGFLSGKP